MNYQETLEFIYLKLPMYTRIGGAAYKADLKNITMLCASLGNPQSKFKSIHIAGTNGKGSTSSMLASVLQLHDYKIGLFTSPHLFDFRERIRVNGEMITEQFVIDFIEKNLDFIDTNKPSFFEITTAMAFQYFSEQNVDYAIIEVGMGGLLDSTNIIHPMLSIITNIGLDHIQFLGNSLQEVATNKAGIIKNNVPVIISETQSETESLFVQTANKFKSPIYFADAIYESVLVKQEDNNNLQCIKIIHKSKLEISTFFIDLLGNYQAKNLKAVLLACDVLQNLGVTLNNNKISNALRQVKKQTGIQARYELVQTNPIIIYDVAHNAEGLKLLMQQIKKLSFESLHIVCGFVADKDIANALDSFPENAQYYFTRAQIPRALDATILQNQAAIRNLIGSTYKNVNEAIKEAKKNANNQDVILVCGSFFIISEIE
jgi:dihydrofolate synthase / folylpolyglutamate synthase